jgi:DcuC family C4-dicarboxylate transporter
MTKSFFEGAGYAYTNVISLIIAAACFVAGMEAVGLTQLLIDLIKGSGPIGTIMSGVFPWLVALLSGSGTTPSVAFSQMVLPRIADTTAAVNLGVVATIAATFGRTMSPVAAVVIFTCTLVNTTPIQIVKRTAPPLACGALVVLAVMLSR